MGVSNHRDHDPRPFDARFAVAKVRIDSDSQAFDYVQSLIREEHQSCADHGRPARRQAVMEPIEQRKIGAHYTSERDILQLKSSHETRQSR